MKSEDGVMKALRLGVTMGMVLLFVAKNTQGAAAELRAQRETCFRLALPEFMVGKGEFYIQCVRAINDVCVRYNKQYHAKQPLLAKGNDQIEFLLWRGLIKKQEKALALILDLVDVFQTKKEILSCLKEVGQEQCLAQRLGAGTSAGLVGIAAILNRKGLGDSLAQTYKSVRQSPLKALENDWDILVAAEEAYEKKQTMSSLDAYDQA